MEPRQYDFLKKDQQGNLILNPEVLSVIKASKNPHFVVCYGKTRVGKSTTLNNIINGCVDGKRYMPKKTIFHYTDSHESVTKGCQLYGPLKLSQLQRNIDIEVTGEADIFFCDTEGFESCNGTTDMLYPGVLTLQQICTSSLMLCHSAVTVDDVTKIAILYELTTFMQATVSYKHPDTILYHRDVKLTRDPSETARSLARKYERQTKGLQLNISEVIKQTENIDHDVAVKLDCIAGGPFVPAFDVREDDIGLLVYWDSLQKVVQTITDNIIDRGEQRGENIVRIMEILFPFFTRFSKLPSIGTGLKEHLTKVFSEVFRDEVGKIARAIKNDFEKDIASCVGALGDDSFTKNLLIKKLGTDKFETYKRLLQETADAAVFKEVTVVRNDARTVIGRVVNNFCEFIESDRSILQIVEADIAKIKSAPFREDVDPNLVSPKHIESLCNSRINQQQVVHKYMASHEKPRLDQTVKSMTEKVTRKLTEAKNSRVLWSEYFQSKKDGMKQEITQTYNAQFATCKYQDDFGKRVTVPDKQAATMIPLMMKKFFEVPGMTNERKKAVETEVIAICGSVHKGLNVKGLKIWADVRKPYFEKITKKGDQYIASVIGQKLRDEIRNESGDITTIQQHLAKEVPIGPDVIGDERKGEIIAEIKTVAERLSQVFIKRRNERPALADILSSKRNIAVRSASQHVDQVLKTFAYREDKRAMNIEDLYRIVVAGNIEMFNDFPHKKEDIVKKIREACQEQLNRYNSQSNSKPSKPPPPPRPTPTPTPTPPRLTPAPAPHHQPAPSRPASPPKLRGPTPALVQEIWNGNWGNGTDRRHRLNAAGWDYDAAQRLVNHYHDAARRVWRGDYGNGAERVRRLQAEGYDAKVVQFVVNCIKP